MAGEREHLDLILQDLTHSEERSPLFYWLLEHHDGIVEALKEQRIRWTKMAERFKAAGLTDATGKPATPRTARETWYQVRRVVASRQLRQPAQRPVKLMPSKISRDVRPAVAPAPAPTPRAPLRAAVPVAGDWPAAKAAAQPQPQPGAASDRKLTGAERTERLRRKLETRDY
jgi:hypothetical protein